MSSASKSAGIPRCCSATLKANSLFPYTSFLSKLSKSLQSILKVNYFYRLFQRVTISRTKLFKTLYEYIIWTNKWISKIAKVDEIFKNGTKYVIQNNSNLFRKIKIALFLYILYISDKFNLEKKSNLFLNLINCAKLFVIDKSIFQA